MSELSILILVLVLLGVLLTIETPVAMALAISGFVGVMLSGTFAAAWGTLGSAPYNDTAAYALAVIPMYILMGMLAFYARIPADIYRFAARIFSRFPGGMGAATVVACAGFGAVNGSSIATAATFAKLSVGEMVKHGYKPAYASALVASAGTLGMIIPPSIVLVMYGIITGESIGKMLVAGIVPGIAIAAVFTLHSLTLGRRHIDKQTTVPELVVLTARDGGESLTDSIRAAGDLPLIDYSPNTVGKGGTSGTWKGLLLVVIVVMGIYGGIMTITESAGVAVAAALVILVLTRRNEGWRALGKAIARSLSIAASTTSMAIATLFGATVFGYYIVSSGLPRDFANWITDLGLPPLVVVAIFLLMLIPIGMVLESLPMMLIFLPLTYPVVEALGFDGVWFGILVVIMVEIGMICPPIGLNVFVVAAMVPQTTAHEIYKYSIVFVGWLLVVVAIFFAFPEGVLWLPELIR